MNRFSITILATLILTLCGCASIDISHKGATMIEIENTGWYLFNVIPIASGDPTKPNENSYCLFKDTVTLENNMMMLKNAMKHEGPVKAVNITSYTTDENIFVILLKRYAYHTSAELMYESQKSLIKDNRNL